MYTVNIVEISTDKIVHHIGCKSFLGANRVEDGILIDLNHERYYTEVKEIITPTPTNTNCPHISHANSGYADMAGNCPVCGESVLEEAIDD